MEHRSTTSKKTPTNKQYIVPILNRNPKSGKINTLKRINKKCFEKNIYF